MGAAFVVAFLRGERADDGEALAVLGELGQVLAEAEAGGGGGDLFKLAAVGVAGLHVERVGLARTAGHPEEDAVSRAAGVGGDLVGEGGEPTGAGCAEHAEAHLLEHRAAVEGIVGHSGVLARGRGGRVRVIPPLAPPFEGGGFLFNG
jgi:hypothetical protein